MAITYKPERLFTLQKNRGTSANLFTDWEVHGSRQGTNNTNKILGQAVTDKWGIGQILPLKKNFSQLLQVGVIGYDQWQVTDNGAHMDLADSQAGGNEAVGIELANVTGSVLSRD